jgi:hypothetical protein
MSQSILARITPDQIVYDPYPHICVQDALAPDYYAELDAAYPQIQTIAGPGPYANNRLYNLRAQHVLDNPGIPKIWRDFFAYHCSQEFLKEAVAFWRPAIDQAFPDLEDRFGKPLTELTAAMRQRGRTKTPANLLADCMLDCQFGVNSPVTQTTSVRVPHVDNPAKLFAGILYFRSRDDRSTGGDLNLYRLKSDRYYHTKDLDVPERFIERVKQVPYSANTLIMWINVPHSLHGVTPRSVTDIPRRYVNFVSESYTLQGDFFSVKYSPSHRLIGTLKRMVGVT